MQIDEDVLREMKSAVFNGGISPARSYVEFFAEAMRWPVSAFAPRTLSGISHEVTWLKGNLIGRATCSTADEAPEVKAAVHPLASVARVDIGSTVRDDGLSPDITRSLTVYFVDGESLTIDLAKFSAWAQRDQADAFIDAVLDWVGRSSAAE
ncbi:hypothetical protein [Mycolicibacterium fortuitum]|uniref:hypothetical protein n=1 Tax=Mycolicibacterium fortuitum TaxID=1766 RepID=UPI0007EAC813|nr:hypothetical protein [Mycolicibacterium fortuitum]OBB35252.1 hypothetical protein A5763_00380 [Mycolicibacterium fortuitum]OBB41123.1 hypothetical protein A5754_17980 [Mycolicibacterium fortuitum]OBB64513.1 hypothetical protein A5755_21455 [Mycolicibacterium fortuitum]OBF64802.1 hypothetical protein A5751_04025 [Mycolicibacterium fortuitum]